MLDKLNKKSWQAQRVLREIDEWRDWIASSADVFLKELDQLSQAQDMPAIDQQNLTLVRAQVTELSRKVEPLQQALHTATSKRVRRARP